MDTQKTNIHSTLEPDGTGFEIENSFFTQSLAQTDPEMHQVLEQELTRQREEIELIASENIVSRAVLVAQGSILTNKYAEGYPGRRYYAGCEAVDVAEEIAIKRVCKLFSCRFANVQPHSGAQANQGVFLALLKPHDVILGMDLSAGGHLTHGAKPNLSGKWFQPVYYGVNQHDSNIDYEQIARLAEEHKPKMIIAGGSAIPRRIDFAKFREIADSVGAFLMADVAHFSGLIVTGLYPNPLPHAHIVTSTTHKTLRATRGGIILTNEEALAKKIDAAMFPGLQGGPLMHAIAGKAVAFGEALKPAFRQYMQKVLDNAKILGETLIANGVDLVTGGTDCHLLLADLRSKGINGAMAESALHHAHITCNKNGIPFDPLPPKVTSGVRLGSPACTTRGFGGDEFRLVGQLICEVVDGLAKNGEENNAALEQDVRKRAIALCRQFPIYPDM